jgi:hypothetical protein
MNNKHFTFNDDKLTLYNKKYELKEIFTLWISIIGLDIILVLILFFSILPKISVSFHLYAFIVFALFVVFTVGLCIRQTTRILNEGGKLRFSIDQAEIIFKDNSSLNWQEVKVITFFEFQGKTHVGFYRDEQKVSIWRKHEKTITFSSKLINKEKFLMFIKQFYSGPIKLQSFS